ncbi:MAG TPA: Rne/Rng family ribonuclease [Terriglobales bacterium]|jgi:Rne/Rng family ribonuclease|nr:Rne/Rng family ribonuclease [Terriglobales bacterium]
MNKELYVSTTPHETKVGITEDDQLAEIYLERENEYTLAGSIYKGRVTRVLPGMQSAFVDIGLERDAFLYVSDFMDLEQTDEDLDEAIPANRPVSEARPRNGSEAIPAVDGEARFGEANDAAGQADELPAASAEAGNVASAPRDFRGRRRRRGRRGENGDRGGRGERPEQVRSELRSEPRTEGRVETSSEVRHEPRHEPREDSRGNETRGEGREVRNDRFNRGDRPGRGGSDSRFQRSAPASRVGRDYDYGPPPGYQPIVLPGESISKYQRLSQNQAQPQEPVAPKKDFSTTSAPPLPASIVASFPDDEPIFAADVAEPLHEQHDHIPHAEFEEEIHSASVNAAPDIAEARNEGRITEAYSTHPAAIDQTRQDQTRQDRTRLDQTRPNETRREVETAPHTIPDVVDDNRTEAAHSAIRGSMQGSVEEQEIEEEEVELASYGEEPGDDAGFEEEELLEVETRAASGGLTGPSVAEVAPGLAAGSESAGVESSANGEAVPEAVLEAEEREAEELELEEAQAEAEALLEAEAIGEGTVDASAEVRGPAPEAMLLQRTQRRGPERGFDRGRGRRGGRRFRSRENRVVPQISELLKEGQEVLIQIAKEPIAKKGARITSHIALPGRFLVFMPTVNHTGVSRKISSEEERLRLKRIIQSERENGGGGFIVRTAAAGATDEELRADIRFLKNLWSEIKTRSENSKAPALIYHDLNVVERVLRDQVSSDFSVIWVDTEQEYERIVRFANRFQPALVKRVKLYTKETPLYDQFGLNEEINKALKSKVWLKSGGYIVINQTEALVAIDVNTGKYVGKTARLEDTIVKTNVDAIKEIVRQVRLRDLGGIIIIDFIDMDERRNRQKVMQALEEALRLDRAPSKVLQFNDFGLVAITRKRVKQSLERTIGSPCPYCQSTGFVKSVGTICNEVYVEMRKISNHLEHSDVMLRVNPEVAKALKANNAKLLAEMEELTKKTIIVKSDPALHQEQFDIH